MFSAYSFSLIDKILWNSFDVSSSISPLFGSVLGLCEVKDLIQIFSVAFNLNFWGSMNLLLSDEFMSFAKEITCNTKIVGERLDFRRELYECILSKRELLNLFGSQKNLSALTLIMGNLPTFSKVFPPDFRNEF